MKRTFNLLVLVTLLALAFGAQGITPAQAAPPPITIEPVSPLGLNTFPFGMGAESAVTWRPYTGWVYQNIPAFDLAVGDAIAFDLVRENDVDIQLQIDMVATTANGTDIPAGAYTTVVSNTQTPANPRGDTISHNFELRFTSEAAFSFPGGGLIIRFSNPSAAYATDATANYNVEGAASTDPSGFFVNRFYKDVDGLPPYDNIVFASGIGGFQIIMAGSTDTTPPVVTVPSDMTVEATGPGGAVVNFASLVSATDETDPANPAVTCAPASGSTFPLGATPVDCQATDTAGNTGHGYFNVTVQDTTPPVVTVPANMIVEATSSAGAVVNYSGYSATDTVAPPNPVVTCVPPSGSTFPLGTTTVNCSATDTAGNTANGSFTINVVPSITTPQLLKMPTFDKLTNPIPWKVKLPTIPFASVRDCTVSLSPNCSVKFVGKSTNPLRYAEQSFIRRGNAGDKFYIGLSSRADSVPAGGLYKVEVFFYNLRNQVVGSQALNFSIGTHDWETVGTTYTVPAAYYRVAFRFTYQKTAGTAWFDNAFLMIVP